MFTIYTFFLKKKSELLYNQKIKDSFFESELANAQIEIKEQTLNYIGQELHDDLGQKLSVARMMTNRTLSNSNEDYDFMLEINHLLGECIQDIRNLSKTFITENVLQFGIIDSLEKEIKRIEKLKLIDIQLIANKHDLNINPKHGLILFRIIQESINNTLKHSGGDILKISILDESDKIFFRIVDNGKGFEGKKVKQGSGLKNIAYRAHLIGAESIINSVPGKGTDISIIYKK